MKLDAFHRGDMDALGEAAERCVEPIWRLACTGFTTVMDDTPVYVVGCPPETAARVTEAIIAAAFVPARRKAITKTNALLYAVLAEAKLQLLNQGRRDGRIRSLANEHEAAQVPEGTPDLDAVLDGTEKLAEPPPHHFIQADDGTMNEACQAIIAALDDRSQRLVTMRWRQGKTAHEAAAVFTCGAAAVVAHERRVRRRVQQTLLKTFPDQRLGPAAQDRLLSEASGSPNLPSMTRERLKKGVLKRTFQEEPRPYGTRLAWGLGAAGVAFALWGLMFARVLPYYGDDVYPAPTVDVMCGDACRPSEAARIAILAPADARFVAFTLTRADGKVQPLLTAPGGGVLRLPFGARGHRVALPYPVTWPAGTTGPATVTAVFTDGRLPPKALLEIAAGTLGGALTSSTTVVLGS